MLVDNIFPYNNILKKSKFFVSSIHRLSATYNRTAIKEKCINK